MYVTEGKTLICTFLFQGILQFPPLLRGFTSWSFPRYCLLFPGFKREEVSPSKYILAVLTKIDLNSTQVSMKAAGGELLLMWNTEHSQNKNFSCHELQGRWKHPGVYQFLGTMFEHIRHPFPFQREG